MMGQLLCFCRNEPANLSSQVSVNFRLVLSQFDRASVYHRVTSRVSITASAFMPALRR